MLISLLVLSHEQIYFVLIWVNHDSSYRGPITLLEPLVVLIGRHKDMLVKISYLKREQRGRGVGQGRRIGLVWCAGVAFGAVIYLQMGIPMPQNILKNVRKMSTK